MSLAIIVLKKYWWVLALVAGILLGLHQLYSFGSANGKAEVQAKWNAQELVRSRTIADLQAKIEIAATKAKLENQRIDDAITESKKEFDTALSVAKFEYTSRLRLSESRASTYKHLSEGGAIERTNLANYASELDRSLEEGRSLVRELRVTLGQCDSAITALSERIKNDHRLFEPRP